MPIYPAGAINTTALNTPDLYVQIVPPSVYLLNGIPTNVGGFVGTATWGPVGVPTDVSGPSDYVRQFGPTTTAKFDMGTHVNRASMEGQAAVYKCVRVTKGDELAASAAVQTNCITFTSKYVGTGGNSIRVGIDTGSAPASYRVTVASGFGGIEVYDNITGSGNALWVAIAAAINTGQGPAAGPSQIVTATAGAGTAAPTLTTHALTGGTNGAGVAVADLIGTDTSPRRGMYALRGLGVSVAALCDVDDTTTFATQNTFALSEGIYMQLVGPSAGTISAFSTSLNTAGLDSYAVKAILGDYEYWFDPVAGYPRYISPQAAAVGKLCNLAPHMTSLNKQLTGTTGTQRGASGAPYSTAELQSAAVGRMDIITNPIPAGNQFGFRFGRNTSSNAVIHGDNYTRMTNYIAATLSAGMGKFVGELQSRKPDDGTRRRAKLTLDAFLAALQQQDMIDDFQVTLDKSNNPDTRIALGYMQADVRVVYLAVVEYFIVNLEGGQSVRVARTKTDPASLSLTV